MELSLNVHLLFLLWLGLNYWHIIQPFLQLNEEDIRQVVSTTWIDAQPHNMLYYALAKQHNVLFVAINVSYPACTLTAYKDAINRPRHTISSS